MSLLYYRWAVTFRQQIRDGRYTSITHVKDEAVTLWKQHSGMYDERCAIHVPTANGRGHTATSYLIFQYLQYWYYQYFPESSSICNTGITSIFQNIPVSAILVLPVFSRIFQYLQYWYYQYFSVSAILVLPVFSRIFPVSTILIFWQ
jgi:hypothetical protein